MKATWLSAAHVVDTALARPGDHTVHLVVDSGVAGTGTHERLHRWLHRLGPRPARIVTTVHAPGGPDLDEPFLPVETGTPVDAAVTVALGGGGLMDRVKLASCGYPTRTWPAGRSGLVVPPPQPARAGVLVAVPTTLGTGAEASAVAVATRRGRRLLVMDRSLRPDAYAHDPQAYLTLAPTLIADGLAEILSRIAGPFVGDAHGDPLTDAVVLAAVDRLVHCADAIVESLRRGDDPALAALDEAARIGAFAHGDVLQRPLAPWSVKLWAIANEVATLTGATKMATTARLWPAFWEAVDAPVPALGDAGRLRLLWSVIRAAHAAPLPSAPGVGIATLLARWGVHEDHLCDHVDVDATAERVLLAWGAGLAPLHPVTSDDVAAVLSAARAGPGALTSPEPLPPCPRT